jgi:cysteine desulfurase / selenocysteine lyase
VLRPLYHLNQKGIIQYDLVPFDVKGFIDPRDVAAAIGRDTRLVILSHASNVLGTIQPIKEIGRLCAEREVPLFVDATQSAGLVPIDMGSMQIAGLAFTGHKSMLGPTGIGGLVLSRGVEIEQTRFGGTGVDSKSLVHTETFPHRLEAGTLNFLGIIGLSRALAFLGGMGIESIHSGEMNLLCRLRDGLAVHDGIQLYCADDLANHVGILTCNVRGMDPEDVGAILDGDFDIAVRAGVHCAPLVHESLGSLPHGGVRFSFGPFNTEEHVDRAVAAMTEIVRRHC